MKVSYMSVKSERFLAFYFKNGGYLAIGTCKGNYLDRLFNYSFKKTKSSPPTYEIHISIFNFAYKKSGN